MSTHLSRRRFLQSTAAGAAGYWLTASAASAIRAADAPNGKVRIACIGVDGKGSSDTDDAGKVGQVVALCDVDEGRLNRKGSKFSDAKKFTDFRKLFDDMAGQIDAVTVSTPDHNHAPASIMAMKLGKHVYCQKPLTHTVYEARQMREVAKKAGVCTQMGNQGSAGNALRRAVEIVQAGIIGPVTEAHVWTNRPVWPQAPDVMTRPPADPIPAGLHWDVWLGPAPARPFAGHRTYHDFNWRGWWDFGTGALGDMACHTANLPYRALKLGFPTSLVAEAKDVNPETYPTWARIVYEFPARGAMPAVKFCWYEGREGGRNNKTGKRTLPPNELLQKVLRSGEQPPGSGSLLVGAKGILYSPDDDGNQARLIGEGLTDAAKAVPQTLPRNGKDDTGMKQEWIEAIKSGKPHHAYSNFDIAGMLTETVLLGNVAIRMTGEKLLWDGPNLQFANNSTANQHLHYEYRKGWTL